MEAKWIANNICSNCNMYVEDPIGNMYFYCPRCGFPMSETFLGWNYPENNIGIPEISRRQQLNITKVELINLCIKDMMQYLPCNIGDTVYKLWYKKCHNGNDYPDSYDCDGCYDKCDIEKAVFPIVITSLDQIIGDKHSVKSGDLYITKEEADNALKVWKER